MMKLPKKMLSVPTLNWMYGLKMGRRLAEKTKGRLIKMVIIPIPSTDPKPNNKMYTIPVRGESMEVSTRRVKAALPATPCTVPTK
jgi:hypothetical protein